MKKSYTNLNIVKKLVESGIDIYCKDFENNNIFNYNLSESISNYLKSNSNYLDCCSYGDILYIENKIYKNMKIYKKEYNTYDLINCNLNEISFLNTYKASYISNLENIIVDYNSNKISLKLKYGGVKLSDLKCTDTNIIKNIMYQCINILCIFEKNNIIHSDIKPSNILVDSEYKVSFIDYGSTLNTDVYSGYALLTEYYKAPEVIYNRHISYKLDVYSLGLSFLNIYISSGLKFKKFISDLKNNYNLDVLYKKYNLNIDNEIWEYISNMIQINIEKRYSASELLNLKIFKNIHITIDDIKCDKYTYLKELPKKIQNNIDLIFLKCNSEILIYVNKNDIIYSECAKLKIYNGIYHILKKFNNIELQTFKDLKEFGNYECKIYYLALFYLFSIPYFYNDISLSDICEYCDIKNIEFIKICILLFKYLDYKIH